MPFCCLDTIKWHLCFYIQRRRKEKGKNNIVLLIREIRNFFEKKCRFFIVFRKIINNFATEE